MNIHKIRKIFFIGGLAGVLLLSSCYKLISSYAPSEVAPGETFEVSFTVIDDGSETQNFVTDWSYAGVRLPKGWEATVPEGAHRQFAEDWVYYQDGSKVNSSHNMEPCTKLTQFYNAACPKTGYTWSEHMGRVIAGTVLQICDKAEEINADEIKFSSKVITSGSSISQFLSYFSDPKLN